MVKVSVTLDDVELLLAVNALRGAAIDHQTDSDHQTASVLTHIAADIQRQRDSVIKPTYISAE